MVLHSQCINPLMNSIFKQTIKKWRNCGRKGLLKESYSLGMSWKDIPCLSPFSPHSLLLNYYEVNSSVASLPSAMMFCLIISPERIESNQPWTEAPEIVSQNNSFLLSNCSTKNFVGEIKKKIAHLVSLIPQWRDVTRFICRLLWFQYPPYNAKSLFQAGFSLYTGCLS